MTNLARQAESHYCSHCGPDRRLTVRWNGQREECWCPNCRATDGFRSRREFSYYEQWCRDPQSVPTAVANRLAAKYGQEIEAVAAGLPPELGQIVREKYKLPEKREGE